MAFIDELDRKITLLGNGVIKKGKDVSETAKLSSEIKRLENLKKEYFESLGEKFFLHYAEVADGAELETFAKITEISDRIEQIRKQLQYIKGVKICKTCNAEIPANSAFCINCGTAVKTIETMQMNIEKNCPVCGSKIEEDQMFCTNCGNRIEKTVKKQCQHCGAYVEEDQIFCGNCGSQVDNTDNMQNDEYSMEEDYKAKSRIDIEIPKQKVCPNCGEQISEDQNFCMNCGCAIK